MASTSTRRPLPALIALLALLVLTALVWWRVSGRHDGTTAAKATTCPNPSASVGVAAPHTLPPPDTVDVRVLNATTRSGLAARTRTTLLADGFRSTVSAADDTLAKTVTGVGQIRYDAAHRPGALLLQYYFPGARLVALRTPSAQVTVSLGPTYRAVVPRTTVAARLAAAKITLATTPTPASTPTTRSC